MAIVIKQCYLTYILCAILLEVNCHDISGGYTLTSSEGNTIDYSASESGVVYGNVTIWDVGDDVETDITAINIKRGHTDNRLVYDGDLMRPIPNVASYDFPENAQFAAPFEGYLTLWPGVNGSYPIQYEIEDKFNEKQKSVILWSLDLITMFSNIKFIPRTSDGMYVNIIAGERCLTYLGQEGEAQPVILGSECIQRGIVAHELLHLLGLGHEHQRPDRSDWIVIHWDNLRESSADQLHMMDLVPTFTPYDFASVMHYDHEAFSRNEKQTISAKNDDHDKLLKAGKMVPSSCDFVTLNFLYPGKIKYNFTCFENMLPMACSYTEKCTRVFNVQFCHDLCRYNCERNMFLFYCQVRSPEEIEWVVEEIKPSYAIGFHDSILIAILEVIVLLNFLC